MRERENRSLFSLQKLKKGEKMSDNIEIVMDIDSLEIFDVIDLDKNENMVDCIPEGNSDEKVSVYDDLNRVWLGDGYYYRPSSLLWRVMKDDVIQGRKKDTVGSFRPKPNIQFNFSFDDSILDTAQ